MNVFKFPFALLAFFGIVAVVPAWMHFVGAYTPSLSIESQFIAEMALPALSALFLASWLQPRPG